MIAPRLEALVVGASAGAFEALGAILPELPSDYPLPILIVVHVPADRKSLLADLLQDRCRIRVREVEDKEPLRPGVAYLAPPDYHFLVEPNRRASLSSEEPVQYARPSIDVLFETAAEAYGPGLVGLILTGANHDGAAGLRAVGEAGGVAVVQAPETASSPLMPQSALNACPDARVLRLKEIPGFLLGMVAPS